MVVWIDEHLVEAEVPYISVDTHGRMFDLATKRKVVHRHIHHTLFFLFSMYSLFSHHLILY